MESTNAIILNQDEHDVEEVSPPINDKPKAEISQTNKNEQGSTKVENTPQSSAMVHEREFKIEKLPPMRRAPVSQSEGRHHNLNGSKETKYSAPVPSQLRRAQTHCPIDSVSMPLQKVSDVFDGCMDFSDTVTQIPFGNRKTF